MSFLGTQRIQYVTLEVPRYGGAWARVETQLGAVPPGPATLKVGDIELVGTVIPGQSGNNEPNTWVGIWRSGTEWDTVLPARPAYQNDAGVKLLTVLSDLARDCHTTIVAPANATMGTFWTRASRGAGGAPRTGRDELAALVKGRFVSQWWIDPLGITWFSERHGIPVTASARVTGRDLTRGSRDIGTESPLAFMPGNVFEGATIQRVIIRESSAKISVQTWSS